LLTWSDDGPTWEVLVNPNIKSRGGRKAKPWKFADASRNAAPPSRDSSPVEEVAVKPPTKVNIREQAVPKETKVVATRTKKAVKEGSSEEERAEVDSGKETDEHPEEEPAGDSGKEVKEETTESPFCLVPLCDERQLPPITISLHSL
jgi:hypothetical protein